MKNDTLVGMILASLMILVDHYLPWTAVFGKVMPTIVAVILAFLALAIPFTWLMLGRTNWEAGQVVTILWLLIGTIVGTTLAAHLLDAWISAKTRAELAENEAKLLRPHGSTSSWDEDAGTQTEKPTGKI